VPVTVLVRGGDTLYWLEDARRIVDSEPIASDPSRVGRAIATDYAEVPEPRRRGWARPRAGAELRAEPALHRALVAAGATAAVADPSELRRARGVLPRREISEDRAALLAAAREGARRLLAGPDETLVALAREEARLERALGRERGAAAEWLAPPEGPLAEHADGARRFESVFAQHHAEVEQRLTRAAERHVPNLARLVGPKVAGRLVAVAGSRAALARVSSARLQLLGAKRRPDPRRGPRFGVIFRAIGVDELPDDRQGRYARTLASLAAIAVRADEFTGKDLGDRLLVKRDRRKRTLLGRGGA